MNNPQQWRVVMDIASMGLNHWPRANDMAIPKLPSKLDGCSWAFDGNDDHLILVTPSEDRITYRHWRAERDARGLSSPIVTGQQEMPEPEFTPADQVEWGRHDNSDLDAFIAAIAGDAPDAHKRIAAILLQSFIIATQE